MEEEKNKTNSNPILFGTISYENESQYEKFVDNMDVGQALYILIASANFSQSSGILNIRESELLSKAIRTLRKKPEVEETSTDSNTANN
jgi:hypothetical protein